MSKMMCLVMTGVAAFSLVAVVFLRAWPSEGTVGAKAKPVELPLAQPAADPGYASQIASLASELQRINSRLDARQARASEPMASASTVASSEPPPRSAKLSPEEQQERCVDFYQDSFESEPRNPGAAHEFETALSSAFATMDHGTLQRVDCRSTLCVVEVRHRSLDERNNFEELAIRGPMKYGAFDYLTDDGRTVAYIAMPGHPLPSVPLY